MKEKIITELKTAYAKLGLSDEAFDRVASLLEKTVTEESEIATVVNGDEVKGLLKTIQGQVDSWKNKFHDKDKELKTYKTAHPDTGDGGVGDKETESEKKLREQIESLTARLDNQEKAAKAKITLASAKAAAKQSGCTDERALKLTEKMFTVKEGESETDAAKRFEAEYNDNLREYFSGGVSPFQSIQSPMTDDESFHDAMKQFAANKGFGKQSKD